MICQLLFVLQKLFHHFNLIISIRNYTQRITKLLQLASYRSWQAQVFTFRKDKSLSFSLQLILRFLFDKRLFSGYNRIFRILLVNLIRLFLRNSSFGSNFLAISYYSTAHRLQILNRSLFYGHFQLFGNSIPPLQNRRL